jgi:HD-like signal output (HDOD) protein
VSNEPADDQSNARPLDYEFATSDELQQLLLEIFQSPNYQPPVIPNVALELAELTKKNNASYEEVIAVLQNDPLIVASVMKIAQSSLYGGRLQSLQNAVQRLGINTLRDIVWQVATGARLFNVQGYKPIMERLRTHSIYTAYASRMIASRAGLAAEHSFLCGLLHDMGISATLIALAEAGKQAPPLTTLLVAIDGLHEQAGAMISKLWQLAPEISAAIEWHHRYDPETPNVPVLSAVICVAESLAEECGYGVSAPQLSGSRNVRFDSQMPLRLEFSLKRLRLHGKEDDLRKRGQELAEQLKPILQA